jgi:hypothetical protein
LADTGATRGKLSFTPWQAFQRQSASCTSDDKRYLSECVLFAIKVLHGKLQAFRASLCLDGLKKKYGRL